ncbi:zf-TFIIB domain-containing protein [Montanilutibacter psychrotolerans]|uniref:Transcription factor zinc-finger domain-containing protein n=1 Tax=Montanilutibacter psychrotolerans TaxID=1327343 RepID=A0A3M8SN02_9GAMM|nr:zf-TFIIB domain-containing protein [Lysobacter psychrotolerans]RNF82609.1 hypothetical protein EER27_13980 [Lysobacter psychrotolerans]
MDCPVCSGVKLLMSDRQGIEIDYCPQCRGVWLDRGELDKLIERSASEQPQHQPPPPPPPAAQPPRYDAPRPEPPRYEAHHHDKHRHEPPRHDGRYDSRYDTRGQDYYKHKKKKSLLGELFDF